jgi:hypothetical protein
LISLCWRREGEAGGRGRGIIFLVTSLAILEKNFTVLLRKVWLGFAGVAVSAVTEGGSIIENWLEPAQRALILP